MANYSALIEKAVNKARWFDGIPEDARTGLIQTGKIQEVSSNSYFYYFGDSTSTLYCVLSGKVRIGITSSIGQEFALTELGEGEWFGEASLIGNEGRILDAKAKTNCKVIAFPIKEAIDLGEKYPIMYKNLYFDQIKKARGAYTLLGGMLFYSLRQRLAGRVIEMMDRYGEVQEEGVLINHSISQNDFAHLCMGSRQRVNKIFMEWKELGIFSTHSGKYLIKDRDALEQMLELDDSED